MSSRDESCKDIPMSDKSDIHRDQHLLHKCDDSKSKNEHDECIVLDETDISKLSLESGALPIRIGTKLAEHLAHTNGISHMKHILTNECHILLQMNHIYSYDDEYTRDMTYPQKYKWFWRPLKVGTHHGSKIEPDVRISQYDNIDIDESYIKLTKLEETKTIMITLMATIISSKYEPMKNLVPLFDYFFSGYRREVSDDIKYVFGFNKLDTLQIIKYEVGSFFRKHVDGQYGKNHMGTLLMIPPNTTRHVGGDLVIYDPQNDSIEIDRIIAHSTCWTFVVLKIGTPHEVTEVTYGCRYVYKCPIALSERIIEFYDSIDFGMIQFRSILEGLRSNCSVENAKLEEDIRYHEEIIRQKRELLRKNKQSRVIDTCLTDRTIHRVEIKSKIPVKQALILKGYYPDLESIDFLVDDITSIDQILKMYPDSKFKIVNELGFVYLGKTYDQVENDEEPMSYIEEERGTGKFLIHCDGSRYSEPVGYEPFDFLTRQFKAYYQVQYVNATNFGEKNEIVSEYDDNYYHYRKLINITMLIEA